MMKGYSPIVTAGLIGYIGWESTFDPSIEEIGNRIGYGLCQWSFSRRNDLINWCNSHGYDYRTVQGQLEYMYYEIEIKDTLFHEYCTYGCHAAVCGGYHEGIGGLTGFKNLKDIYEVVWCFTWWWGRPGAPCIEERYEIAQTYYTKFYINNPGTGGTGGIGGLGDLIWPSDTLTWGTYCGHFGIDIRAFHGTPIYAAAAGTVLWAGWSWETTYGNYVRLYHPQLGLMTAYAHQSSVAVSVGQSVSQGQVIGYVGDTGNADGPHIHYEIYENATGGMSSGNIVMGDNIYAWSKYYDYNWLLSHRVSKCYGTP